VSCWRFFSRSPFCKMRCRGSELRREAACRNCRRTSSPLRLQAVWSAVYDLNSEMEKTDLNAGVDRADIESGQVCDCFWDLY